MTDAKTESLNALGDEPTILDVLNALNTATEAERAGNQHGAEYHAPDCPRCGSGDDRFVIWPDHASSDTGRFWCRRCGYSGDGIDYLREEHGLSWAKACDVFGVSPEVKGDGASSATSTRSAPETPKDLEIKPPEPTASRWKEYEGPSDAWREAAVSFCTACKRHMWNDSDAARSARSYLHNRGFTDDTIETAGLGLNGRDRWPNRTAWGLDPKPDRDDGGSLWLPRGVVIPWGAPDAGVIGVNIRRPSGDVDPDGDGWKARKYQRAAGPSSPLFGAERADGTRPVVLVEGEFDALAVRQCASDLVHAVATGSTGGARRKRWRTLLASAPAVLVAFDAEEPGEEAARVWTRGLPNALRWPPHAHDTADMLETGLDVRMWVRCGLRAAGVTS